MTEMRKRLGCCKSYDVYWIKAHNGDDEGNWRWAETISGDAGLDWQPVRTVTTEFGTYWTCLQLCWKSPTEFALKGPWQTAEHSFIKDLPGPGNFTDPFVVRLSQFSYVPSYDSCCCSPRSRSHAFGDKHQHPHCHSVSVFPNRRIKGGIRNFVGQPWPVWTFCA